MIYFEEVMSGLCSEAAGVDSTGVQFGHTTSVDLNRHIYINIFPYYSFKECNMDV